MMECKKKYTFEEWEGRKEWYISKTSNLNIPLESTTIELKKLISYTNNLLSYAYIDKATIFEELDNISNKINLLEKECWVTIDWDELTESKGKLIKEQKEAYIYMYIKKMTTKENQKSIYEYQSVYSSRSKFIETVVYSLKDKLNSLYYLLQLLKIENEQLKADNIGGGMVAG